MKIRKCCGGRGWLYDNEECPGCGSRPEREVADVADASEVRGYEVTLLGIKDVPCPTCKGRGTITIDPRAEREATDLADGTPAQQDDAIGAV